MVPGFDRADGQLGSRRPGLLRGGNLPAGYDGALFFTDYNRDTIWVIYRGARRTCRIRPTGGRSTAARDALDAVNLEVGPDGTVYFPDFDTGTIRRIQFVGANQPPDAVASGQPDQRAARADRQRSTAAGPATRRQVRSPTPGTWTATGSSTTRPRPHRRSPTRPPGFTPSSCGSPTSAACRTRPRPQIVVGTTPVPTITSPTAGILVPGEQHRSPSPAARPTPRTDRFRRRP